MIYNLDTRKGAYNEPGKSIANTRVPFQKIVQLKLIYGDPQDLVAKPELNWRSCERRMKNRIARRSREK